MSSLKIIGLSLVFVGTLGVSALNAQTQDKKVPQNYAPQATQAQPQTPIQTQTQQTEAAQPGIGDTDLNQDGRGDLDQIREGSQELGQRLSEDGREVARNAEQGIDKLSDKIQELDDAEVIPSSAWPWILFAGLVLLLLGALMIARRKRGTLSSRIRP
ncbi:MAG: hypothetical protein CVV27_18725 [Candidatus Melainabacteria bacterium HGW-Melainabacteria-1]|nr:MAG: hypothetical protein CVV27_18725 [Candidatus Melainabacteria bacterium HGW-Melainabacteria-1]